jgi:hypothetical protein
LLDRYLAFWRGLVTESKHVVLLFACVCEEGERAERMHSALAAMERRFEKKRDVPVAALSELSCVTREYVERWFDLFTDDFALRQRSRTADELFAGRHCQPMSVVEQKLVAFQGERNAWETRQ